MRQPRSFLVLFYLSTIIEKWPMSSTLERLAIWAVCTISRLCKNIIRTELITTFLLEKALC